MIYHKYRFGFSGNIKVALCRTFGHRINENPAHHWCQRCGLAYEEAYHPKNYYEQAGITSLPSQFKNYEKELSKLLDSENITNSEK